MSFRRQVVWVIAIEAALMLLLILLGTLVRGERSVWFIVWGALFITQSPGITAMEFWEQWEGRVPDAVYLSVLYGGAFCVQVLMIVAVVSVGRYLMVNLIRGRRLGRGPSSGKR